ncbi:MAG: hypothetical protein ACPG8W_22205 [Candidatus Promineifilaceae bacterium]
MGERFVYKQYLIGFWNYGLVVLLAVVAFYFFLIPAAIVIRDLNDPALRQNKTPAFAYRWHRNVSRQMEPWARERVETGRASTLNLNNISGTEWPVFSAVYYLWATESLQAAWEADPSLSTTMPTDYAEGAIRAAAALVADPNHAAWVQQHWGDDYLHQENIFYRMLLIGGLTSYQELLGETTYEALLIDQVQSLSRELDASPYGLLDDYPNQCYPIDILPAIAVIQRASVMLDMAHEPFVARSVRGFSDTRLDPATMLPTYIADSETGVGYGSARGIGASYMLIWAPELWPEVSEAWYTQFEQHFWQEGRFVSGIREFPVYANSAEWLADVDAGPVIAGYGTAASAFGIGATRANGRFDHAFPLSAEALVSTWPLPNGTLLGPRMLSNLSDAPLIGETALLFSFTRQAQTQQITTAVSGGLPLVVYAGLLFYSLIGLVIMWLAYLWFRAS